MRRLLALLALLALAALAPLAAAARPAPARAGQDWSSTMSVTPAGAFVLGNPRAKVRLVEYLSMTCPHCAHFTAETIGPLTANYVAKGLVSLEVRHAIRDSLDIAASLLVRCNGPKPFFGNMEAVLAAQDRWIEAAVAFQEKDRGAVQKLPPGQALASFVRGAGLDRLMAGRGLPPTRVNACVADKKQQDLLAAMAKEAWQTRAISGTPAFLINDVADSSIRDWPSLEAAIKGALG